MNKILLIVKEKTIFKYFLKQEIERSEDLTQKWSPFIPNLTKLDFPGQQLFLSFCNYSFLSSFISNSHGLSVYVSFFCLFSLSRTHARTRANHTFSSQLTDVDESNFANISTNKIPTLNLLLHYRFPSLFAIHQSKYQILYFMLK